MPFSALLAVLVSLALPPEAASLQLSTVATRGDRIAGLEESEWLGSWGFERGINQNGQVIFRGSIVRTNADGSNSQMGKGIWFGKPGAIQLIARDGQPVPRNEDGLVFAELLETLELNDRGEIAFLAKIGPDRATPQATALFFGTADAIQKVAQDGDDAHGFESISGKIEFKTNFNLSPQSELTLGESGALAWTAAIQAPNTVGYGLWLHHNGTSELISPVDPDPTIGHSAGVSIGPDGSVVFVRYDTVATLYHWKDSELTRLAREAHKIGDSTTRWASFSAPYYLSDGRLIFSARTRLRGETREDRSIWQWQNATFHSILEEPITLIPDQLVSQSKDLNHIPGIDLITYTACGKHPVNPDRTCDHYIFVDNGTERRVVAHEGMPFPGEPEGTEIVLEGIPGLIDRSILVNERGSIVAHLGKRKADDQVIQGIYRLEESEYPPIVEEGDIVSLGNQGDATAVKFHVYTEPSRRIPLRSLNNHNQLFFWITTAEFQDTLVVADIDASPSPSITISPEGITLEWDGVGTLEAAPQVSGPWTAAANQAQSQTISPDAPTRFFRSRTSE